MNTFGEALIPTTSLDRNEAENTATWLIFAMMIVQISGMKWPHVTSKGYMPAK